MSVCSWVDGVATDRLAVDDRGLSYGDGLFETLLVIKGRIVLKTLHWERLQHSCERLFIDVDWVRLESQVNSCLHMQAANNGIIKIIVTRGSGGRGYNPVGTKCRTIVQWFARPEYPVENKARGVRLYPCKTILGWQPTLAGMKHLNRLEQVLARQEWCDARYVEGVLCDMQGQIIECTMSNIFLVYHGKLVTPDLSLCGVAGVMRQWIMQLDVLSSGVDVRHVTSGMLHGAEEVFICNSVFGVWPVIEYASYQWSPGVVTRRVQEKVESLFHDENMD